MMSRAMGAAKSRRRSRVTALTVTATAMRGFSAGAKPMNHTVVDLGAELGLGRAGFARDLDAGDGGLSCRVPRCTTPTIMSALTAAAVDGFITGGLQRR